RQAACRHRQGAGRSRREEALRRPGRGSRVEHPGSVRGVHPGRNGEVRQAHQGSQHQGQPVKLYGFWRSLASYRVRVALAMKGMHAEEISIDLLKGKQNEDDYLAVNPQGVVPALVLDEGGPPLFQSLAILEYLEEVRPQPSLLPKDARGR